MGEGKCITSDDVKVHFTFVPVDPALSIIKHKLQQGMQLYHRTSMSIHHIITLLEFCLTNTYFLFQNKYCQQVHGAVMGFPISLIVANLLIEEFETKAINTAPNVIAQVYG